MKAILIGATGATGSDLLQLLLNDVEVESVAIFVRRELQFTHPKLEVHLVDFNCPEQWRHLVKWEILFSCLGTTLRDAGSKEEQWKVDHEYQYRFAEAARENGVETFMLISSMNASARSPFFYARMKGELEEAVQKLGFPRLMIFRPPSLIRKGSNRTMERVGVKVIHLLNRMGLLRSMRPMPTERLATAMLRAAKSNESGSILLEPVDIEKLAQ